MAWSVNEGGFSKRQGYFQKCRGRERGWFQRNSIQWITIVWLLEFVIIVQKLYQKLLLLLLLQLKLVSTVFIKVLYFRQMIALQKLWKMLFISSKKLFSFWKYSIFCISLLPSFSNCRPLLWRMIEDKS